MNRVIPSICALQVSALVANSPVVSRKQRSPCLTMRPSPAWAIPAQNRLGQEPCFFLRRRGTADPTLIYCAEYISQFDKFRTGR